MNQKTAATVSIGPTYYLSPENYALHREELPIIPGKKSDVWALGVLLVEMCMMQRLNGLEPSEETKEDEVVFCNDAKDGQYAGLAQG